MDHALSILEPVSSFVDAGPRYPESLSLSVPLGTRSRIKAQAEAQGVTVADLGRRIIDEHLAKPPPGGLLSSASVVWKVPGRDHALITVGAHEVARVWATSELDKAVLAANRKVPGSPFDPDVLRRACEAGRHQLWIAVKDQSSFGMAVTGILTEANGDKVLTWVLVTGRAFLSWAWSREHIEAWAREQGCRKARAYARPGWQRRGLSDYEPKGVILERSL